MLTPKRLVKCGNGHSGCHTHSLVALEQIVI